MKKGILTQLKASHKKVTTRRTIYLNGPTEGNHFTGFDPETEHLNIQTSRVTKVEHLYRACRFTTKSGSVYLLAEDWSKEGE